MKAIPFICLPFMLAAFETPLNGQPAAKRFPLDGPPAAPILCPDEPAHVVFFLERYRTAAATVSAHFRVPACILLSVAALESSYGRAASESVAGCNNFFNIKTWVAEEKCCQDVVEIGLDEFFACFRKYDCPEDSFWDFGRLMQSERYQPLTFLPRWDYRSWAVGLQEAGYATDTLYAAKLVRLIERCGLNRLDPMPFPHPYDTRR